MLNVQFPKSSSFTAWALERAPQKMDVIEYEGQQYQEFTKVFTCNIGKKAASIYAEIGTQRVYLINTEFHQVWIEKLGCYISDYGRMRVGEARFELAACCRCHEVLGERESALMGACEDCIDLASTDPESLLEEFSKGAWG